MPHNNRVATIQILTNDDGRNDRRHLFSGLPIHSITSNADERQGLLDDDDEKRRRFDYWIDRGPRIAFVVSSFVCVCFVVVASVTLTSAFSRITSTVRSIDDAVSIGHSAANMIKNVDSLLNTSTKIATVVEELGIRGIDASIFSKPYLTRVLNTTTLLLDDVHRVAEHPQIQIG